jgi:hypothetical protein
MISAEAFSELESFAIRPATKAPSSLRNPGASTGAISSGTRSFVFSRMAEMLRQAAAYIRFGRLPPLNPAGLVCSPPLHQRCSNAHQVSQ